MRLSLSVGPFLLRDLSTEVPSVEYSRHGYLRKGKVGISEREIVQTTVGNHGGSLGVRERSGEETRSCSEVPRRGREATRKSMPTL